MACLACALELYVFLHLMIRDDGIPYYFIWLTNWTGMATVAVPAQFTEATQALQRLFLQRGVEKGTPGGLPGAQHLLGQVQ